VYFFFASLMICSTAFVFFLMPETKGVPLESMDRLFANEFRLHPRKAQKIVMAELREEEEGFRHNVDGAELHIGKEKKMSEEENVHL
jgi:hypothetical protein